MKFILREVEVEGETFVVIGYEEKVIGRRIELCKRSIKTLF